MVVYSVQVRDAFSVSLHLAMNFAARTQTSCVTASTSYEPVMGTSTTACSISSTARISACWLTG